jgi:hypothetical protein
MKISLKNALFGLVDFKGFSEITTRANRTYRNQTTQTIALLWLFWFTLGLCLVYAWFTFDLSIILSMLVLII